MIVITRILTILIILISLQTLGQKRYYVDYVSEKLHLFIKHPKSNFKDSIAAFSYLKDLQNSAIAKGYLLASIDSTRSVSQKSTVYFYLGEKHKAIKLTTSKENIQFLRKHSKISEKIIAHINFTPNELARTLRSIHSAYVENGYPFVVIKLEEHEFKDHSLSAKLTVDKGPYMTWTKINIKGDSSVSVKYISNLLNIKKGGVFVESEIQKISTRILQVPFLKEIKPSEILFTKEGVELFLYLESLPISSINGIVGFQPDPISGKISFTGELNLKLLNVLKRGELLDIKWQSIRAQTQSLDAQLNYPFLFNTSFGIDGSFNMYKRDTSFLELNSSIGVEYYLNTGSKLKVFYQNITSNVLSGGLNNPTYSKLGNTKSNNYGLSFSTKRVDYIPNPSKGFNLLFTGSVGTRKLQINDTTQIIKSLTYRGQSNIEFFLPITRRHVVRLSNRTEFYSAPTVFQNELYRFGGLIDQRGFNEDELLSTTKSTSTLEYRFLLDRNSHVFAFFDQTWYENNSINYYNDSPFGFGVGFSFSTNFGVFSISYALGKQLSNPIQFSNSKVHFGYIVYF
ncbi:MAG TPA: hypothetical protein EYG86_06700 [Crocinitomicaceae bacterium]|nr:hypothetical protein [Crocinitomicaceae bacterium]